MLRPNRVGISGLGDGFLPGDLTAQQVQLAQQAYQSGSLSASGLNQVMSGNVASANFADFLAADLGAPQTDSSGVLVLAGIFVVGMLLKGPRGDDDAGMAQHVRALRR